MEVLRKKFLTDKVEDKKEGNENRKSDAEDVWGFSDVYGSEKPVNRKMKLGKVLRKKRKSSEQKYWERVKDYELLKKLYLDESASEVKPRKTKKKKQ